MSGVTPLSGYAHAVVLHVVRQGGTLSYDHLADEMIENRRWHPESFYSGLSEAVCAGKLRNENGTIVRVKS